MTLTEFEHGYWYASELKSFASKIGIPRASQLRKEELEASIRGFLSSGEVVPPRRSVKPAEAGQGRGTRIKFETSCDDLHQRL